MDHVDQETWNFILTSIKRQARKLGKMPRARFGDWLIVAIYLWSVWHDRSQSWACDRVHYGRFFRPRKLPSISQLTRRIKTQRCRRILQGVHEDLADIDLPTRVSYLDGKPLTVGPASKDLDAKRGHIMGGFAKGYKIHAWGTEDRRIPLWSVESLPRGEQPVAVELTRHMPQLPLQSLVLADQNYDGHELYRALANKGGMLVVEPRGYSEHPKTRQQMGPARREALLAWQQIPEVARYVHKDRIHVEGLLSNLCSYGGGLGPLPAWVRTLERVRRWVGAKIIIYHARLRVRKRRKKSA